MKTIRLKNKFYSDRIYPCVQNFQIAVGISKSQFRNLDLEFPNLHSQHGNTFPNGLKWFQMQCLDFILETSKLLPSHFQIDAI